MKKWIVGILGLLMVIAITSVGFTQEYFPPPRDNSGIIGGRAEQGWASGVFYKFTIKESSSVAGNPTDNTGWIYGLDVGGVTHPYWEDKDGTATDLISSAATLETAYGNGETISLDGDGDIKMSLTVTGRNIEIANTFAGTQAIGLEIDAEVAQAITDALLFSCTAGTITDAIDASNASIVNAINVGANVIVGTTAQIDFSEFDVAAATGSVTINDDGDAGAFTVEGTSLDINSLDFVGAGAIVAAASSAITLNPGGGDAAGEDLIITAHNISLTANGLITGSPDAALAIFINAEDTDIATAISVGANDIVGTTGLINFNSFDVDASGNVNCAAITATSVTAGTILQNAVTHSAAGGTLTLDGKTTGGVTIGATSTGTITLGGGATLVNLPSTVDLTIAGGEVSITSTSNTAATLGLVNNTVTTQDMVTISSTSATSGELLKVTAGANYTGSVIYAQATDASFTGKYIECYDGGADDFTVGRYGATLIAGSATGTDALTLTNGDILVTAGNIDITTGAFTVGTGSVAISVAGNFTTASGYIDSNAAAYIHLDSITNTKSHINRNIDTTDGPLLELEVTNVGDDQSALLVDYKGVTNGIDAVQIAYDGDTDGAALQITNTAVTGRGIDVNLPNSLTSEAIYVDLGTWLGTASEGALTLVSDNAVTIPAGMMVLLWQQGTGQHAGAIVGSALNIIEAAADPAAAGTNSYALHINSTNNIGSLYVTKGDAVFNDDVNITIADSGMDFVITASDNDYAAGAFIQEIYGSAAAGQSNNTYLLRLAHLANNDAQNHFIEAVDNSDGTAGNGDVVFSVNYAGLVTAAGGLTGTGLVSATTGMIPGNATDSTVRVDTVELTAANILDLKDTKITLVADPGADYFIEVNNIVFILDFGGVQFNPEAGDDFVVEYGTSGVDIVTAETAGWLAAGADAISIVKPATIANTAATSMVSEGVVLFNADATDIAAGNGTVTVKISYTIQKAGL